MEPPSSGSLSAPIDRVDARELSVEEFKQKYLHHGIPCVITHADLGKATEWTIPYLREKVGNNKVTVRRGADTLAYKLGTAYDLVDMSFNKYVDNIYSDEKRKQKEAEKAQKRINNNADGNSKSSQTSTDTNRSCSGTNDESKSSSQSAHTLKHIADESNVVPMKKRRKKNKLKASTANKYYMAVQNVKKVFPTLLDECPMPKYCHTDNNAGKLHAGPYLWIAPKGHFEYCHVDPDDGMLIMYKGRKRIRLYTPDLFSYMYPNHLGSMGKTLQSQVDVRQADLDKFPLFAHTQGKMMDVTIHPGEMLFIPAFCWHQVTSIDICISQNIFWGDAGEHAFIDKMLDRERCFRPSFLYWLTNVLTQNQELPCFTNLMKGLKASLRQFFFKTYHERVTDAHLDDLVSTFYAHFQWEQPTDEKEDKEDSGIKTDIRNSKSKNNSNSKNNSDSNSNSNGNGNSNDNCNDNDNDNGNGNGNGNGTNKNGNGKDDTKSVPKPTRKRSRAPVLKIRGLRHRNVFKSK